MKPSLITGLAALWLLAACSKSDRLCFDPQPVSRGFVGNGVEWSAYPHADAPDAEWGYLMTDAKLERVFRRLDFMRPRIVRIMDVAGWRYYKGTDAQGEPLLDFRCPEVEMVCRLLDYCQRNGIRVLLGDYGVPGFWGYPGGIDRADDPRFARMTARYLEHLIRERGFDCIDSYILTNEPNGDWACTQGDWEQWRLGAEQCAAAFAARGLEIGLSAPDVVEMCDNPRSRYTGREWVTQSIAQLDPLIGNYNVHCYADAYFVRRGDFRRHYAPLARTVAATGKPLLFGEIGVLYKTGELGREYERLLPLKPFASEDSQLRVYDYDYGIDAADALIQAMQAGAHGASAWMLDDAMHTIGDAGDPHQLKVWGFWNSLGEELLGDAAEERIRPWFFTWSLMCRCFTPGMEIFAPAEGALEGIRAVMGHSSEGMSVALLNATDAPRTLRLPEELTGRTLTRYDYAPDGYRVDEEGFPLPAATAVRPGPTLRLPGRSFVLFTDLAID